MLPVEVAWRKLIKRKDTMPSKNQIKKQKTGFTIIEVVLVLAIAGLIFLMVFVALPALQRSQRDTQRRDDMARFISQLTQYQANNNGNVPGNTANDWNNTNGFIRNYMTAGGDSFRDPDGTAYNITSICVLSGANTCGTGSVSGVAPNTALNWDANRNLIYVYKNAKCNGEQVTYVQNSPTQVAIRYKLEGAGTYCTNN